MIEIILYSVIGLVILVLLYAFILEIELIKKIGNFILLILIRITGYGKE